MIHALIIRQLVSKYGRRNIGFLWIVTEPIILCAGVLALRTQISGTEENGVSLIAILWTGYIPLTLWRHLSSSGVFAFRRATHFLYHRHITLLDCLIATVVNELAGCTLAGAIVYFALFACGLIQPIHDYGLLLFGWLNMALLASAMMVSFAVLTEYWEPAERFVQPFQYLLIPLCGFFFLVDWLPNWVQKYAWYMPTIHCYEMIRAGLFGPTVVTHYSAWYPGIVALFSSVLFLPLIDKARDKLHFG